MSIDHDIAIVGMSVLYPGSVTNLDFWRNIVSGKDLIEDVPKTHWLIEDYHDSDQSVPDKTYGKRGGFLPDIEFDALDWGIPPKIMSATDTTQLLGLIVAKRCMEDAFGPDYSEMDLSKTSVILGATSAQELLVNMGARLQKPIWLKAMRENGVPEEEAQRICQSISDHYVPWQESTFPGLLGNVIAGRIANRLDLGGSNCVTDAACASTFSALAMGVNELLVGDADIAMVGGADTMNDIFMHMCFSKTPALSKSGDCRPFSDQADGTLLGEGLGFFVLKRRAQAEADGDAIYALIRGVGSSSDGRSKSVYAPVSEGQAKALCRAYDKAGFSADTIELVEAHGTGTKAGDAAEFGGLCLAFDTDSEKKQWCALGTVKSQIGHAKAAAGAAGLFKAVMALHHKTLPPSIKIDRPNPNLKVEDTPFYLNTATRPWIRDDKHPRRAGVSSFGFGGSNFHLALEEYIGPSPKPPKLRLFPHEIFPFSAADDATLIEKVTAFKSMLSQVPFSELSKQSQAAFSSESASRVVFVADQAATLATQIDKSTSKMNGTPFSTMDGIHYGVGSAPQNIAVLFPGQGSQSLNMSGELSSHFSEALSVWDEAATNWPADHSLTSVVFPPPAFDDAARSEQLATLTKTEWAQPAIGVASLAYWKTLQAFGVKASRFAGHSYGEVTALHAAGALNAKQHLEISRKRGELMAEAASAPGAMSAAKAASSRLQALLDEWGSDVVIANHNSPTQSVLSGPVESIAAVEAKLGEEGIFAQRLNVATAFHSKVVASAVKPFAKHLNDIATKPLLDSVYANSTAKPYSDASLRDTLSGQIAEPVRFVDMIQSMYDDGCRVFIEVGPRNTLGKLTGRILKRRKDISVISTNRPGKSEMYGFLDALAKMSSLGISLDFQPLWVEYGTNEKKEKPAKMGIMINGANYGKPYPPSGGVADLPPPNPPRANPPPPNHFNNRSEDIMSNDSNKSPVSAEWLVAFQAAQAHTAQAHAAYQQAMSNAHVAYLQACQSSFASLAALAGSPIEVGAGVPQMPSAQPISMPTMPAMPTMPSTQPVAPTPLVAQPNSEPVVSAPVLTPTATSVATGDVTETLMTVVAEKTGYPPEMLSLEMNLEGDLGIDSIKRVEILSAMQAAIPSLPEVDAAAMASLQTLGQIAEYLQGAFGAPTQSVDVARSATSGSDLNSALLSVVSEKTGYPAEMLSLEMNLEGDLGIDSIKRVEILSAMQAAVPDLPEVDAAAMSSLQTLGQIVDYLQVSGGSTSGSSNASGENGSNGNGSASLSDLLMAVVSDKTGYPSEMLNLEMSLEGDLGIDSIKRVEILSAMQEREPSMPQVDAAAMAQLQTLGQIVVHMQEQSGNFSQAEAPNRGVSATTNHVNAVKRQVLKPVQAPASGLISGAFFESNLVILHHDIELARALAQKLKGFGIAVRVSDEVSDEDDGVIDLRPLREFKSEEDAKRCSRDLFLAAKAISNRAKALISVQDLGGDFGFCACNEIRLFSGGVAGVARSAAVEWPQAHVKAIDIARGSQDAVQLADKICMELLYGGPELDVGLPLSGLRTTLGLETVEGVAADLPFASEDTIVVSGGARGVTADCVIALAEKSKAHFFLFGRTQLLADPCQHAKSLQEINRHLLSTGKMSPKELRSSAKSILAGREIRATLEAIHAVGATAEYAKVDVTDSTALSKEMERLRASRGRITGLIHGAGALADKLIADKEISDFDWVFNIKVGGLQAMLAATQQDSIRSIALFSSVAARVGNRGQSDYAAANVVLNKYALHAAQSQTDCVVKSFGWGPWAGGMVTESLKRHFESMGVDLIPIKDGAARFVEEFQRRDGIELVLGGGLSGAPTSKRYQILVSKERAAFLFDHQIKGKVVVPMALAAEWFLRAVSDAAGRPVESLQDLAVRRSLILSDLATAPHILEVEAIPQGDLVQLRLFYNGQVHYSAVAHLGQPGHIPAPPNPKGDYVGDIYGGALFHGPSFQMIDSIVGASKLGFSAKLTDKNQSTWPNEPWFSDVSAIDGGLQLALLWTAKMIERNSAPMKIAEISFSNAKTSSPIERCNLLGISSHKRGATSDAFLVNAEGQVSIALRGVETIAFPAGG